jgi:hypothetical protein
MIKSKGLLVAAFLLAALAATLYWSNHHQSAASSANVSTDSNTVKFLSLNRDDVTKIEIKKKGGDDVVLTKGTADKWKLTSPKPLGADADTISGVLSTLSSVSSERLIEDKAADLKLYGLAEPVVEVNATLKDGNTKKLLLGDDTPASGAAYAMLEGDPRVFTVSSSTKTSLDKGMKDLGDKRLLPVDFDKIAKVEVVSPKLNISFGSKQGQWTVQSPKDVRGDTSKLEGIVEKIKSATLDLGGSADDMKKSALAYAGGTQVATVRGTDDSGTQEFQVRKNKDLFYAKTTAAEGFYKVPNELAQQLQMSLDDIREKRLFDFSSNDPEKMEIHFGSKAYSLSRAGQDWTMDGKKMDAAGMDNCIRNLRLLVGTKFAPSGFASILADLTVTSTDGKLVEKVQVSKNGNRYIAKRENDPLQYELDPKVFEDFQKSFDELKPAEQPAAKPQS